MAKKKSSFHMGDEFNGSGKKTYLRPTQHNTYAPLLQYNVRLTPNFTKFVPVAIGALPIGMETTLEGSDEVIKATGSIASSAQIIIEKDKITGIFQTGVPLQGSDKKVAGDTGNIVEWYVIRVVNGKNKSAGLNRFNRKSSIIIYWQEVLE